MAHTPKTSPSSSYERTGRTPPFLSPDPRCSETPSPRVKRQSFGRDFSPITRDTQNALESAIYDLFPDAAYLLQTDDTSVNQSIHLGPSDFPASQSHLSDDLNDAGIGDFLIPDRSPSSSSDGDSSTTFITDDVPSTPPFHEFPESNGSHQQSSISYIIHEPDSLETQSAIPPTPYRSRSAKRSLRQFLDQTRTPEPAIAACSTSLTEETRSTTETPGLKSIRKLGVKSILMRYYGLSRIFAQKLPTEKPMAISPEVWKTLQSKKDNLMTSIAIGDHGVTVTLSAHFDQVLLYDLLETNKTRSIQELISFYDQFSAIFAIESKIEKGITCRTITLPKEIMALFPKTATKKQVSNLLASFFKKLIVNTCVDKPKISLKKQNSIYLHHHLKGLKQDQMINTVIKNTIEEMSSAV